MTARADTSKARYARCGACHSTLRNCSARAPAWCCPDCHHPLLLSPELLTVQLVICKACLDGIGEECHTPGCALYMHRVDLPIAPVAYVTDRTLDALQEDDRTPGGQR